MAKTRLSEKATYVTRGYGQVEEDRANLCSITSSFYY